ncbi:dihydrolipoyl dehydrogenase family protein [Halobium salinum]|uniref:Dihydrolipoyl dehydrogenase family protein n=1 Tax=Halobium salinum TaxID=1364940 RepID=A0ABD5PDE1_9EURY|nr:dihydrolipoyl dehydrogenase [Halobium salinum]
MTTEAGTRPGPETETETHDLLVLGGGTGNIVAAEAAEAGLDVALVEKGPLGGTCLNRGCNPSKQLIHRADLVEAVEAAGELGVDASVEGVDFADITRTVTEDVTEVAERKAEEARERESLTLYRGEGRFVDERAVAVELDEATETEGHRRDAGESVRVAADRVVLAGGSRPVVPDVDGLDEVDYLTSDDALRLEARPDRLVVVGGGYIAAEMGHFYAAMGTEVVVVGHGDHLLPREDEAVSEFFTDAFADGENREVHTGYRVEAVEASDGDSDGDDRTVTAHAESDDGDELAVDGDALLLAVGRRPNTDADGWAVDAASIETDDDGFVMVDERLRTSVDGVWAIGDVADNYNFKHSGDKEAAYAVKNAVHGEGAKVEFPGMAHAVFGSPQVGSLGRTASELDEDGVEYEVGRAEYSGHPLGKLLQPEGGFVKALVGADEEVLGCHVVGPEGSTLIHEVNTAVASGGDARDVAETIHVHPALSELVQSAFRDALGDVGVSGL